MVMDMKKKIGANITKYREAAKFNQEDLAHTFGRTQGYLSLIEKGHRNVDAVDLFKIAQNLNIPVGSLYAGLGSEKVAEINLDRIDKIAEAKKAYGLDTISEQIVELLRNLNDDIRREILKISKEKSYYYEMHRDKHGKRS